MRKSQIRKIIKQEGISFLYLQFSDLLGRVKNVVVHVNKLEEVLENGVWFDGSSVEGFARVAESDMLLRPDLNTFAVIPWSRENRRAARFICDIYRPTGRRLKADPRFILQKIVERAKKMGFSYQVGAEFEFYLFEREALPDLKPHDDKSYFDYTPHSRAAAVCERVMRSLAAFGIRAEMHHHEVGPGQHEIDIHFDEALKSADNIMTLKMVLKAETGRSDLKASWMPKPIFGLPGNGLHVHQSLWQGGRNLFYHPRDRYFLSSLAKRFLAGQLAHARGLSAVVSPTVNSYKRLVSGFEAPVFLCWAHTNRSALIRIPRSAEEKAALSARLEYRAPDPSANPYLAFAALLAAGLAGIKEKKTPPPPLEENVYRLGKEQLEERGIGVLPATLGEALVELEKDEVVLGIFGSARERFLEIKKREWQEYLPRVTQWEIDHYL